MKKDATEKKDGVSDDAVKDQAPDPRTELVDSIVQKNDEIRRQEMGTEPEEDPDEKDQVGEKDPEPDPGKQEDEPEDELIELLVDGEKVKMPLSKVLDAGKRTMQKESAADKRLEEATRLLKEAEARAGVSTKKEDRKEEPKQPPVMSAADIVKAIQYGGEEDAEKAIQTLMKMSESKDALTADKAREIAADVIRTQTSAEKIKTKFEAPVDAGGFADIAADPYLFKLAADKVNEALASGAENTWETYEAAGKEVREWVAKFSPKKDETGFEEKRLKKKTTDTVRGATASGGADKTTQKPPTASEVVAEIAASRPGSLG